MNSSGLLGDQVLDGSSYKSGKAKKRSDPFPKLQMLPIDNSKKSEKEKREIPRRRKPMVQ